MINLSKKHKDQLIGGLITIILASLGLLVKNFLFEPSDNKTPQITTTKIVSNPQIIDIVNKESAKQTINEVSQANSNTGNVTNEFVSGDKKIYNNTPDKSKNQKKETSSEVINAPNALIVTNRQSGGQNIVNNYQNEFKTPDLEINKAIDSNLKDLVSHFPNHPSISIELESGNSQRNKVAIQLEAYFKNNNLGQFPKGNTNINRFPDYPVSIFFNPDNKPYIDALIKSISPYLKTKYQLEEMSGFPLNYIRFYINGQPQFETSGKVTIE